jgi:hypothetical protein
MKAELTVIGVFLAAVLFGAWVILFCFLDSNPPAPAARLSTDVFPIKFKVVTPTACGSVTQWVSTTSECAFGVSNGVIYVVLSNSKLATPGKHLSESERRQLLDEVDRELQKGVRKN